MWGPPHWFAVVAEPHPSLLLTGETSPPYSVGCRCAQTKGHQRLSRFYYASIYSFALSKAFKAGSRLQLEGKSTDTSHNGSPRPSAVAYAGDPMGPIGTSAKAFSSTDSFSASLFSCCDYLTRFKSSSALDYRRVGARTFALKGA